MKEKLKISFRFRGDKYILLYTAVLVLFSFAIVFSTSSNLVNLYNIHTPWFYLFKHAILLALAAILFFVGMKIPVEWYKKYIYYAVPLVLVILLYTFFFGVAANHTEARRWIRLGPVSIQPSLLAIPVLMIFTAVFLDNIRQKETPYSADFKKFWIYVFAAIALIVPHNNSTGLLLFLLVLLVLWMGGYPFRKIFFSVGLVVALLGFYYLLAKAFPGTVPNRFATVEKRIKRFFGNDGDTYKLMNDENLQTQRSKIAIATGGFFNFQPGKSVQKNLLPQASSDFVFSIIIEEYGLFGGLIILSLYVFFIIRIHVLSLKLTPYFNRLLIWALALPIVVQAVLNMFVAVGILPVTGQPLPLISTGGTTIMTTGFSVGIIIRLTEQLMTKHD